MGMLGKIQSFITHTNPGLLAGRRSVLAIDDRVDSIRILELKNKTSPFHRQHPRFEVTRTLQRALPIDHPLTEDERFALIGQVVQEARISSRLVALPIPRGLARSCLASVPREAESIDGWVDEQYHRIFEFAPPRNMVTLCYEVLAESERSIELEITCFRTKESQELEDRYRKHGYEIVWLGSSPRALKCAWDITHPAHTAGGTLSFGFVDSGLLSVRTYREGKLTEVQELDFSGVEEIPGLLTGTSADNAGSQGQVNHPLILGTRDSLGDQTLPDGVEGLNLLGTESEDAHLLGLAASTFYPEISGVSLESQSSREQREGTISKILFQRLVLSLGLIVMVLLGAEILVRYYLESQLDEFTDLIARSGVNVQGLTRLEDEVKELRQRVEGTQARGPIASGVLHRLAKDMPDSSYLSSLALDRHPDGSLDLSLKGYAEHPGRLAQLLSKLESSEAFKRVNLLRSASASSATKVIVPASLRRSPCIIFEASVPEIRVVE